MRYCTTHSTTAAFRSPVSMFDSSGLDVKRPLPPTSSVRKPNSSFSWRSTGSFSTASMNGSLKCSPGPASKAGPR
jgi:hypothetical protein